MDPIRIYYDGDCPFCARYVRYLRLRESLGQPELVDLRQAPAARDRFVSQGLAPDKGMLVERGGRLYAGADAMHLLSLLSTPSGPFNRLIARLTATPHRAAVAYPLLRAGRAAALLALGRRAMDAGAGWRKAPYGFFLFAFGVFGFLHLVIYAYRYGVGLYPSSYLVGLFGLGLAAFPLSRRLFLLLVAALAVDGYLQAPIFSNHTILKNFLVLGVLLAGLESWARGENWAWFVQRFAPVGRWLLLVMYVFGVFHKINADFLNPDVSCAVTLLQNMPLPALVVDNPALHWASIYGTLVIETAVLVCLLVPAARNAGVYLGIGFHALLALSGYALYAPFSTLAIALHCLFLPPFAHARLANDPRAVEWLRAARRPLGLVVAALYALALAALAANGSYAQMGLLWLAVPAALLWAIRRSGEPPAASPSTAVPVLRAPLWGWLVIALFFFNCATPYLGLKTAQSMNMFANLRLEDRHSNHLLLPHAPGPFGYLEAPVEIVDPGGVAYFARLRSRDLRLTWYDFLSRMDRAGAEVAVDYRRRGELFRDVTRRDLAAARQAILHAGWFRRWFHFAPVNLALPKPCARDN